MEKLNVEEEGGDAGVQQPTEWCGINWFFH